MTGNDLVAARKAVGLTQQQFADLCGIHFQTLGRAERQKEQPVQAKQITEKVSAYYNCIDSIRKFMQSVWPWDARNAIPCPCDFFGTVAKGDPLVLCPEGEEAVNGDLIVLLDTDGTPVEMGRVTTARKPYRRFVTTGDSAVDECPSVKHYRVVDMMLRRPHNTDPKTNPLLRPMADEFPPDLT